MHAPCLLVTQRVWSPDPWERLRRAAVLAETLGAPTVVVHPPFTWQRDYARGFADGSGHGSTPGSPGMRVRGGEHVPGADGRARSSCRTCRAGIPTEAGYDAYTLDLSHCAAARSDALAMADRWAPGWPTSTSATAPARGATSTWCPAGAPSPARELLASLAGRGFTGRWRWRWPPAGATSRAVREADLAASLAFARQHLAAPSPVDV